MSTREGRHRAVGLLLVALILGFCVTPQFRAFISFPNQITLPEGEAREFDFGLPFQATVRVNRAGGLALNGQELSSGRGRIFLSAPVSLAAVQTGRHQVEFRLFGLIPFRKLDVEVVPPTTLVPGGHSIGVLLRSKGVVVVGLAAIRDREGQIHQPGRAGGIEVGDAILSIGGVEVTGEAHAARLFESAGKAGGSVHVIVSRKGKRLDLTLQPVQERESGRWRVGLYIRDGTAGVGTVTFYDPQTGRYGALGHVIADADTSQPFDVRDGHIVEAVVTAVQRGRKGLPGEKISQFKNEDNWMGSIDRNSRFGIFGQLSRPLTNPLFPEPLPVAMASQVKVGPAEIITVVEGQRLERFKVQIVRVMPQPTADGKNMIVKITDERLLEKTGGIVQGMSGSPILQDGRIVGAVTHVFVNDPTRGYGALIEWMLREAGLLESNGTGTNREERLPVFA